MLIQQGDVLIQSVKSIPKAAKKQIATKDGYILAMGEATGHAHRIADTEGIQVFEKANKMYLRVEKQVPLVHEEHNTVNIEPGIWEVKKVREYDHFERSVRPVSD